MSDSNARQRSHITFDDLVRHLATCRITEFDRFWVAYSGGVDSTLLLHAASKAFPVSFVSALHVNHGLSPNADDWQKHCEDQAQTLDVEFVAKQAVLKGNNLELAGRRARLIAFEEVLTPDDIMATAHHSDDELESLLWQLLTGRATVGIAEWRNLDQGWLWRPFLDVSKADLIDVARANGFDWIEDESNQDTSFTRNSLRHEVIPLLKESIPESPDHIRALKVPPLERMQQQPISVLSVADSPLRLRAWLHAYGHTPRRKVVDEILRQAQARNDANVCVRVSSIKTVRRYGGLLYFVHDRPKDEPTTVCIGEKCRMAYGEFGWKRCEAGLKPSHDYELRSREGGEQIVINEQAIRLSDWFYDRKIPPWERDAWPLMYFDNELVAVPGIGVADCARQTDGYCWFPDWIRSVDAA